MCLLATELAVEIASLINMVTDGMRNRLTSTVGEVIHYNTVIQQINSGIESWMLSQQGVE